MTATNWLVYRLTGSALLLGVLGFAGQFPAFLLGPFAGIVVDSWDRHRLLVGTQTISMLQSFMLAFLTLTGLTCGSRSLADGERFTHEFPKKHELDLVEWQADEFQRNDLLEGLQILCTVNAVAALRPSRREKPQAMVMMKRPNGYPCELRKLASAIGAVCHR